MKLSLGGRTLVAVSLSISLLGSSVVMAQTTDATVTGQITDQAGRSVPHASVILTNLNTNVAHSTDTNDEGIYRLPALEPGIYRANIIKDGFQGIVKGDIELQVQDQVSINFTMQIGSVSRP